MAHIAVTGGSGKLGRYVVLDLLEHGYHVVNLDTRPAPDPLCPMVQADLSDLGQATQALHATDGLYRRLDAVVHLAAVPAPGLRTDAATFHNNLTSTYNVFSAARAAGIETVVWASSETVLGLPFDTPPAYLPLDEESPPRPESSYALSKLLGEEMSAQMCRWEPSLRIAALRFSNVMEVSDYAQFPSFQDDPKTRRWNAWSYIDARDGAQATRLAVERAPAGASVFVIASPDTVMHRTSAELAAAEFTDVELRGQIGEHQALMSSDRAAQRLGYRPQHTWRDHV